MARVKSTNAHKPKGVGQGHITAVSPSLLVPTNVDAIPSKKSVVRKRELSDKELAQVREINCNLVGKHILTYAVGRALWQKLEGPVADLPVSPLLRMVEDLTGETPPILSQEERGELFRWIGERFVSAVQTRDAEFFLQLGVVLRARREGRDLSTLTAKELGIARTRGRKPNCSRTPGRFIQLAALPSASLPV